MVSGAYTFVLSIGEEAKFGGFVSYFMEWLPMNVWIHKQEEYSYVKFKNQIKFKKNEKKIAKSVFIRQYFTWCMFIVQYYIAYDLIM